MVYRHFAARFRRFARMLPTRLRETTCCDRDRLNLTLLAGSRPAAPSTNCTSSTSFILTRWISARTSTCNRTYFFFFCGDSVSTLRLGPRRAYNDLVWVLTSPSILLPDRSATLDGAPLVGIRKAAHRALPFRCPRPSGLRRADPRPPCAASTLPSSPLHRSCAPWDPQFRPVGGTDAKTHRHSRQSAHRRRASSGQMGMNDR